MNINPIESKVLFTTKLEGESGKTRLEIYSQGNLIRSIACEKLNDSWSSKIKSWFMEFSGKWVKSDITICSILINVNSLAKNLGIAPEKVKDVVGDRTAFQNSIRELVKQAEQTRIQELIRKCKEGGPIKGPEKLLADLKENAKPGVDSTYGLFFNERKKFIDLDTGQNKVSGITRDLYQDAYIFKNVTVYYDEKEKQYYLNLNDDPIFCNNSLELTTERKSEEEVARIKEIIKKMIY